MKFKQISAIALSSMVVMSQIGYVNAASDAPQTSGEYTAKIEMLKDGEQKPSMCDGFFDRDVEVSINGETTQIDIYVVSDKGGKNKPTLSEVVVGPEDGGTTAVYKTHAEERVMDIAGSLAGVKPGDTKMTDKITITVPTEELLEDSIDISAKVNMINTTQSFDAKITAYTSTEQPAITKSSTVTGVVAANESTYEVVVPSTIDLGEMNTSEDSTVNYELDVTMTKGNDELSVTVSSDASGKLTTDSNETIEFTNDFESKTFTETGKAQGTLSVAKEEIADVSAGTTYSGTLNFNIKTNK